jgi:hypothetical protein
MTQNIQAWNILHTMAYVRKRLHWKDLCSQKGVSKHTVKSPLQTLAGGYEGFDGYRNLPKELWTPYVTGYSHMIDMGGLTNSSMAYRK